MKKETQQLERRGLPGGPNEMFTYTTGVFSTEGFRMDSPDVNNYQNIIPSGSISMKERDGSPLRKGPIHGVDNLGNEQVMYPGFDYEYPGTEVTETLMAKMGGALLDKTIKCGNCGWEWKAADGGSDLYNCHKCKGGKGVVKAQVGIETKKPLGAGKYNTTTGDIVDWGTPEYERAYNRGEVLSEDGVRSEVTLEGGVLPEVVVENNYKKGFWEQSRDKYLKDNADAGLLGALGSVVTYPLSVGQNALTYGTTGKVQDPSEAWGHNTQEGWFDSPGAFGRNLDDTLLNVFADPANLIGAGILTKENAFSKLAKIPRGIAPELRQGLRTAGPSFGSSVDNVTPTFKSEIDWENWVKTNNKNWDAEDIKNINFNKQEYDAIEQQAKADGTWMKYEKKVLDEEKTLNNKTLFDEQEKEFNLKNAQEEEVRKSLYEADKAKIKIEERNKLLDSKFQDYFDNASAQWKRNFENDPESKLEFLDIKGVNSKEIDNALEFLSSNVKSRETDLLTKYESVPINKFDKPNESVYNTSIEDFPGTPEQFIQSNSQNFKEAYPEGWETVWRGGDRNPELNTKYIKNGEVIFTSKDEYGANVYNRSEDPYVKLKEGETPPEGLTKLYAPKTENKIVIDGDDSYIYDGRRISGARYRTNYARLDAINQTPSTLLQQENLNTFQKWMRNKYPEVDLTDRTMTDHFASFLNSPEGRNIDRVEFKKIFDGTIDPIDVEVHNLNNQKQLKSMFGNNGMFDMTNPNIYKAIVPGAIGLGALQQEEEGAELTAYQTKGEVKIDLKHSQDIYDQIRPSEYTSLSNYGRYLFGMKRDKDEYDDDRSEEAFKQYLGLNSKPKYLSVSKYAPSIKGEGKKGDYYKVDPQLEQDIFYSYKDKLKLNQVLPTGENDVKSDFPEGTPMTSDGYVKLDPYDDNLLVGRPMVSRARMLGNFNVSRGKDEKGEYISYSDQYDFPGVMQSRMKGKPYKIYNRIYYNDMKEEGGEFPIAQIGTETKPLLSYKDFLASIQKDKVVDYKERPQSVVIESTKTVIPKTPKKLTKQQAKIVQKDLYEAPFKPEGITSGDKAVDFLYNNEWLMDVPILGSYIKDKAKEIAKDSGGRQVVDDIGKKAEATGFTDELEHYTGNTNFIRNRSTLLDQYFSKDALLPKSKYKPTSDYLEFLPSYSVKGDFDKDPKQITQLNDLLNFNTQDSKYTEFLKNKKPIYLGEGTGLPDIIGVDLGGHKTGIGWDDKMNLPYLSVSDAWDFEPSNYSEKWSLKGSTKKEKDKAFMQSYLMHKAGNPFKIYDRFYFNPETKEYIPDYGIRFYEEGGETITKATTTTPSPLVEYVVKKGDTLSKIAAANNTSVRSIMKNNKSISDPNVIGIDQKINIVNKNVYSPKEEVYKDWNTIRDKKDQINKLSDEQKIVSFHNDKPEESYLIVDKKNAVMKLYTGGNLTKSFEVGVGQNAGDAQTVTKVKDGKTDWSAGNKSTGAGIYTISNINPASEEYYNEPAFNLKNENGIEVSTTIHGTPKPRRIKFNNGTVVDNRMSNGCINGKCEDLKELYGQLDINTKVYILPEDKGNNFQIVDGKPALRVSSQNRQRYNQYIDQTGITQKGQGANQTTNTLVYKPIKATLDETKFKDNVFQWNDFNDEKEYTTTTKPFIAALTTGKKDVMKAAKISSDVYNELAKMSFGIYGTESNFGDTHSAVGNLARATNKVLDPKSSSSPDYKSKASTYGADEETRSVGLTQLRWNYLNADEKKALKEVGITSNKDFLNPKKAAIGTVTVLGVRYNQQLNDKQKQDVWKYLPTKWNNRANYSDRVKSNSSYLSFKQLDKKQEGGENIYTVSGNPIIIPSQGSYPLSYRDRGDRDVDGTLFSASKIVSRVDEMGKPLTRNQIAENQIMWNMQKEAYGPAQQAFNTWKNNEQNTKQGYFIPSEYEKLVRKLNSKPDVKQEGLCDTNFNSTECGISKDAAKADKKEHAKKKTYGGESKPGSLMQAYSRLPIQKKMGGAIANKKQFGGQLNSGNINMYRDYIKGIVEDKDEALKNYDKLNRIYYTKAKESGMTVANYIMTHIVSNS